MRTDLGLDRIAFRVRHNPLERPTTSPSSEPLDSPDRSGAELEDDELFRLGAARPLRPPASPELPRDPFQASAYSNLSRKLRLEQSMLGREANVEIYVLSMGQADTMLIVGPPPARKTLLVDAGEVGHEAEGKDRLEAQMILNHKAAIEMLVDQA